MHGHPRAYKEHILLPGKEKKEEKSGWFNLLRVLSLKYHLHFRRGYLFVRRYYENTDANGLVINIQKSMPVLFNGNYSPPKS